jgi:hypothetical protein
MLPPVALKPPLNPVAWLTRGGPKWSTCRAGASGAHPTHPNAAAIVAVNTSRMPISILPVQK